MADDSQLAEATAPLSFAEFLERMKEPAAADLVRSIKNFIKTFDDRKPDPEHDSQLVQDFLAKSEIAFRQHPVWVSAPNEHQAQAIEGLEKYLMTKVYHKTFAASALDKERDEALAVRMTALSFIQPQHLDIPKTFQDEKAWLLAMKELHKINSYKAPRDKLVCILNCCRIINNLLHMSVQQGEARGADDFLPVLIYVVIHANPPQLASNLEYIQRFRMNSRMVSESSYFFTQLYSAASFIETINTNSLTIDSDEFVARMVAAGVPDMQLLPQPNSPVKPAIAKPVSPTASAPAPVPAVAEPPKPQIKAPAAAPPPPASVLHLRVPSSVPTLTPSHSAQATPTTHEQTWSDSNAKQAAPEDASRDARVRSPSVADLEREGVVQVLSAEAQGELRVRHPYLYASAADLRVCDVEVLLAAYKQLVLRYEALSLAVAQYPNLSSVAKQPGAPESAFADPPPAVPGPNPFADPGSSSGDFNGFPMAGEPIITPSPSGMGRPAPSLALLDTLPVQSASVVPGNSGNGAEAAAALGGDQRGSVLSDLASGLSGVALAAPLAEVPASSSLDMLSSASLTVPATVPLPIPQPTLAVPATQSLITSGGDAAAAAAAFESAATPGTASRNQSTSPEQRPSENLPDMRTLSFATEDIRSANELRDGNEGAAQTPASKPALTPLPTVQSAVSEVEMPRPELPSPFGEEDAGAHQEVVMPRPSMPSPFHDPHTRLSPTEDAALPPKPASPFDQPATEGVTLPAAQMRSPFDQVTERGNSAAFPRAAFASPFDNAASSSVGGASPPVSPGGLSGHRTQTFPVADTRKAEQRPNLAGTASAPSGAQPRQGSSKASSKALGGFASSPFARAAGSGSPSGGSPFAKAYQPSGDGPQMFEGLRLEEHSSTPMRSPKTSLQLEESLI